MGEARPPPAGQKKPPDRSPRGAAGLGSEAEIATGGNPPETTRKARDVKPPGLAGRTRGDGAPDRQADAWPWQLGPAGQSRPSASSASRSTLISGGRRPRWPQRLLPLGSCFCQRRAIEGWRNPSPRTTNLRCTGNPGRARGSLARDSTISGPPPSSCALVWPSRHDRARVDGHKRLKGRWDADQVARGVYRRHGNDVGSARTGGIQTPDR